MGRWILSLYPVTGFILLSQIVGCASGPDSFQPAAAHDPGPWEVRVHSSYVRGFWLGFGPYRTDWAHAWSSKKKASEVGIQQVDFQTKGDPATFELVNAYGDPIYMVSGFKPAEKSLDLGLVKIPTSPLDTSGVIACGGQPIGHYSIDVTAHDKLGFKTSRDETLLVGDSVLVVEPHTDAEGDSAMMDVFTGRYREDYILNGEKVASLELRPKMRIWISQALPAGMQHSIAIHAARKCVARVEHDRQQVAANLSAASALAGPH